MKFIHKLRERPEHHRTGVAFFTSAAVTAAIAVVWVTTFSFPTEEVATAGNAINIANENVASTYDSLKGQFDVLKEQFNPDAEQVAPVVSDPNAVQTVDGGDAVEAEQMTPESESGTTAQPWDQEWYF